MNCRGSRCEQKRRRSRSHDGVATARGALPSPSAHVARAMGEGSKSDVEARRDEAKELKEAPAALGPN